MRERECGRRGGARRTRRSRVRIIQMGWLVWPHTHRSVGMARGIRICRRAWPAARDVERLRTTPRFCSMPTSPGRTEDGRGRTADGRRRRPGPSASPARSSPRWGSPKGPLRDRSQCDAVWGDHPTGKARHRWSAVDLSANSLSNTSFFFCPLSPPVRSSFRRAVQPGSGAWPLTTDGPVQSSSVSAGGNHEEKIQGQPKGGRSGLPRPVPPVHAWELVRTAHVDELTASNSGCGAAGHDATASGIPVPARGTPHCDDRVFLSRPGHAGAVSECDVADCGRV